MICCRRFKSLVKESRQAGVKLDDEGQVLAFRDVAEVAFHRFLKRCKADLLGLDRDRAGLDFREIEDVIDEIEQIGSRGVDVAGKIDLLWLQIAAGILGELLTENEDRVQRRAQLVRHVREELGLILRGQREFRGFFFERAPGLFDFHVLALDLRVSLGELPRLLFELLVGLLKFLLSGLQFDGELLALLEQAFGAHGGFDRVQHDADGLCELLEEA